MRKIGACDSDLLTVLLAYTHIMLKACLKSVFDGYASLKFWEYILIVTRCPLSKVL